GVLPGTTSGTANGLGTVSSGSGEGTTVAGGAGPAVVASSDTASVSGAAASGPGAGTGAGVLPGSGPATGGAAGTRADGPGVTAKTITVGVLYAKGAAEYQAAPGGSTWGQVADVEQIGSGPVHDINPPGGIAGRRPS